MIVELLRHLAEISGEADAYVTASFEGEVASIDYVLLGSLREAIDEVPIHELPIPEMAGAVLRARRAARMLDRNISDVIAVNRRQGQTLQRQVHFIRENRTALEFAHLEAQQRLKQFTLTPFLQHG